MSSTSCTGGREENGRGCRCYWNSLRGINTAVDWLSYILIAFTILLYVSVGICSILRLVSEVRVMHTLSLSLRLSLSRTLPLSLPLLSHRVTFRSNAILRRRQSMSMTEYFNRVAPSKRFVLWTICIRGPFLFFICVDVLLYSFLFFLIH